MYRAIYNPAQTHLPERWKKHVFEDVFKCLSCGAGVYTQPWLSGVQNRNHCPFCLSSRHLDHAQPGDRLSACKALMQPIGLTMKRCRNKYGKLLTGELMLIHQCGDCGKLSINRIAADDMLDRLMEIFNASMSLKESQLTQLEASGIQPLTGEDAWMVELQLLGITQQ